MVRDVSDRWRDTANTGGRLRAEIVCHSPELDDSDDTVNLTFNSMSIKQSHGTGTRWTADVDVIPMPDEGTWDIVSWPGAWFEIRVGWRYGPGDSEWLSFGEYCHDDSPTYELDGPIELRLTDRWSDLDKADFDYPQTLSEMPITGDRVERTQIVQNVVRSALGTDQSINITVEGGDYEPDSSDPDRWDSRSELIEDMADDGNFVVQFDADGTFVMRKRNSIGSTVAHFNDGSDGNIMELDRGGRFESFYNRVCVYPDDIEDEDGPRFDPQTATLDESNHPLDPSNRRGLIIPYHYESKTIDNERAAARTAAWTLRDVLKQRVERTLSTFNGAHIEPGDTVSVSLSANAFEGKRVERWFVTDVEVDALTGECTLDLASRAEPTISEDDA